MVFPAKAEAALLHISVERGNSWNATYNIKYASTIYMMSCMKIARSP